MDLAPFFANLSYASSPYDSCHCIELPFVFGTWDAWDDAGMLTGIELNDQERLTKSLQSHWIEFMKFGQFDNHEWKPYRTEANLKVFV